MRERFWFSWEDQPVPSPLSLVPVPRHRLPIPNSYSPNHVPLLQLIDDVHARNHAAEDRVLRIEVRLRRVRDEVLAAASVGPRIERHADRAPQVRAFVQLVADRVRRSTLPVAAPVAVLDHEVGDHTVEAEAVEAPLLRERHEAL